MIEKCGNRDIPHLYAVSISLYTISQTGECMHSQRTTYAPFFQQYRYDQSSTNPQISQHA